MYSLSTREGESEEADKDGEVNHVLTQHTRRGVGPSGASAVEEPEEDEDVVVGQGRPAQP